MVGQFGDLTHAVHHDDLLEALIGFGVADDAQERRQAGAAAQQIQVLAGQQVVDQQRAGGLAANDDLVAELDVLKPATSAARLAP